MNENNRQETARRALLGDADAIRQLLKPQPAESDGRIPVLQAMVKIALEERGYSIDEILPSTDELGGVSIPLLTETADGTILPDARGDLCAMLELESRRLVDEIVTQNLTAMELELRAELEAVCRRHIENLLGVDAA